MNKLIIRLATYAGMLCWVVFISSCSAKKEQTEARVTLVKVQQIEVDYQAGQREYIGTVESDNAVDVSFPVAGAIEQLHVQEGQRVSKGQLLGRLNTVSLGSAHKLTVAAMQQAEDAFQRMSAMYENKSLPEIQYIDVKTKLAQAQSAEAIARKNLQDATLYAPQSGVIGKQYAEPGTNVMPGTPVFNIMDIGSVKIKIPIPENEISGIANGTRGRIQISALNNRTFEGQVTEKGVVANLASHTYDIKIKISNPEQTIMPGMVCKVYLDAGNDAARDGFIVPIKSVQAEPSGKRFVWLVDGENKAVYKEVTLGGLAGNGVLITSGLQAGAKLITEGYQNVSNGAVVTIKN